MRNFEVKGYNIHETLIFEFPFEYSMMYTYYIAP